MTMIEFKTKLGMLLAEKHDPRKNYAKEIAFLIEGYAGNKNDAFAVVASIVDFGFYNMIRDEYRFYFNRRRAFA